MRFLLPVGGIIDHSFGIMTTPGHKGIPMGIKAGMWWAADNQAFTRGFDPDKFFPWLDGMTPYRNTCLFIPVPDVVGNAAATLELFTKWREGSWWPCAFVAQDGQEALEFPPAELWETLFLGGSSQWKMSDAAVHCIQRAQALDKRIHIGRVNYKRRYDHFAGLPGSERWTCDGTRTRYGRDRALIAWAQYMAAPRQLRLPVPARDSVG